MIRAATASPKAVSRTSRVPRSTRAEPRLASISLICIDSAGWLTAQLSAARPKWHCAASATK